MGSGWFFPRDISAGELLNHYFDCAKYWKINPIDLLAEPFSALELLATQANRINRESDGYI
ncbi:hypothetical protein EKS39_22025 [Enterobacter roggenkampii]|nr:hypothetical protein FHN83_05610 [Leclercia adecarboxylata]RTX92922.1 hypothetical protein EKS39_22025 [Enterobacter roggenkampii]RTY40254.1 hypothetical protein EKS40_17475 [Enterobacter roggenkampii]